MPVGRFLTKSTQVIMTATTHKSVNKSSHSVQQHSSAVPWEHFRWAEIISRHLKDLSSHQNVVGPLLPTAALPSSNVVAALCVTADLHDKNMPEIHQLQ